jgi:hypothetical protein
MGEQTMRKAQSFVFFAQPYPPLILLAWAVFAPGLASTTGDSGYIGLFVLLASPLLLAALLVPSIIAWSRRVVRSARATSRPHVLATLALWGAGAILPLFIPSVGDGPADPSAMMRLGLPGDVSTPLAYVVAGIEVLAWGGAVVFAGFDPHVARVHRRSNL